MPIKYYLLTLISINISYNGRKIQTYILMPINLKIRGYLFILMLITN